MKYDVVIVGGGIAGLTSSAYLTKYGYKVILLEQNATVGGLINSFKFKDFTFDAGIRAIENSGIVFPMLKQLGIHIDFKKSPVAINVTNKSFIIESKTSIDAYEKFLAEIFPESKKDISKIISEIRKVMHYMDVLYGIDNPLFVDYKNNPTYTIKTILPWYFKYLLTIKKIEKLNEPIYAYLSRFTTNMRLIDIIAQHFFYRTPAFFALSYFSLYLDYYYPSGGTGVIPEKLADFIIKNKGDVKTLCRVKKINLEEKVVITDDKSSFFYKKLIWAADASSLYNSIEKLAPKNEKLHKIIEARKTSLENKTGSDSILTVYMTLNCDLKKVKKGIAAHTFYTPTTNGLSNTKHRKLFEKVVSRKSYPLDKKSIFQWVTEYLETTTYEISCPSLRDSRLAPTGQTGLIVSTLFDYGIVKHISTLGLYKEFKSLCEKKIAEIIFDNYLKLSQKNLIDIFSSTPLSIEKITSNKEGSITGWAFTNSPMPSVTQLSKISDSIKTPLPDVYQVGQWAFSPAGLPTSILTGKLAADMVSKKT